MQDSLGCCSIEIPNSAFEPVREISERNVHFRILDSVQNLFNTGTPVNRKTTCTGPREL